MPCPHHDIKIVQRSNRQSAVAAAAYQSGERLFSEYDQKQKYYSEKRGIVHTEIMLPPHAPPEYADRNNFCLPACSGKDTKSSGESISPPGCRTRSGLPGSKLWAPITRKKPLPPGLPEAPGPPGSPGSAMGRSVCSLIFRTISRPSKAPDTSSGRPLRI